MNEQVKRVGRPKSETKLTPAQKQKAYRQRQAINTQVISQADKDRMFSKNVFSDLEIRIKQLEIELAKRDSFIKEFVDHCSLYSSVLFSEAWVKKAKAIFSKKSNVTKTYKQTDIEDQTDD